MCEISNPIKMDQGENGSNYTCFVHHWDCDSVFIEQCLTFVCSLLMVVLCAIGAIGNSISAFLFTRRSMRSSINVLLASLSCVDLLVLLISIPLFAIPGLNAFGRFGSLPNLEKANLFLFYPLAMTAQTCSISTLVLITVERYFAVCFPFRVQHFFTARRASVAQFSVIALSVLYNFCRFWEYRSVYDQNGQAIGYVRFLRANVAYFLGYYTCMYLVINFWAPFTLIAVLNARIARTIVESNCVRMRLITSISKECKRQSQITRMVAIVTVIFAACNCLPFCLNIWEAVSPLTFHFEHNREVQSLAAYLITEGSNILVVLNSSVNFVIYIIYCRKYRTMFIRYFMKPLFAKNSHGNRSESVECAAHGVHASESIPLRSRFTSSI